MNTNVFLFRFSSAMAFVLAVAILMWATGAPSWLSFARAAALTDISDTLSDSDLSATSDHAFAFTTTGALDEADTIVFSFDPSGSAFTVGINNANDVTGESGLTVVATCGGGSNELTMATTSETITLTVCGSGDTVPAGAKTLTFDNNQITNPSSANSYVIRVTTYDEGNPLAPIDTADTRVAILDDVTVTASVDTIFNFTVAGVASGTTINGDSSTSTATTTSATSLPFGTLQLDEEKILAQALTVETNAANGFTVTVMADDELTSATGANINFFQNAADNTQGASTPISWVSPANTLGSNNTYGHFGVTSEDATLAGGDDFGTALYAGNFNGQAREVFYHDGPSNGLLANSGTTRVGYKIEIRSLQEAGNDYTATLTYVATPVF